MYRRPKANPNKGFTQFFLIVCCFLMFCTGAFQTYKRQHPEELQTTCDALYDPLDCEDYDCRWFPEEGLCGRNTRFKQVYECSEALDMETCGRSVDDMDALCAWNGAGCEAGGVTLVASCGSNADENQCIASVYGTTWCEWDGTACTSGEVPYMGDGVHVLDDCEASVTEHACDRSVTTSGASCAWQDGACTESTGLYFMPSCMHVTTPDECNSTFDASRQLCHYIDGTCNPTSTLYIPECEHLDDEASCNSSQDPGGPCQYRNNVCTSKTPEEVVVKSEESEESEEDVEEFEEDVEEPEEDEDTEKNLEEFEEDVEEPEEDEDTEKNLEEPKEDLEVHGLGASCDPDLQNARAWKCSDDPIDYPYYNCETLCPDEDEFPDKEDVEKCCVQGCSGICDLLVNEDEDYEPPLPEERTKGTQRGVEDEDHEC